MKTIRQILQLEGQVTVSGWIRSVRTQKNHVFVDLSDGIGNIQCLIQDKLPLHTGMSLKLSGTLQEYRNSKELHVQDVKILGEALDYPLHKQKMPMTHLREWLHLRPRTRTFQHLNRTRSNLELWLQEFLHLNDFTKTTTPILTQNDCEGGGEAFVLSKTNQKHFFGSPVYLSVSGQLHLEALSAGLSRVYTLGPCFRAERSDSTRHLAEFWMLEAEMSFIEDLSELLDFTEHMIQHVSTKMLQSQEFDFFKQLDPELQSRLEQLQKPFKRLTYHQALDILLKSNQHFQFQPSEDGLQTEHEKYLASLFGPVFVTDYPSKIKPFYMKPKNDVVECMDLILPGMGEIVGGSLREDNYVRLKEKMQGMEGYDWYLDLRKYGSVPHGGFGMGMERLLAYMTGIWNVRDLIPFPRYMDHCQM
ncbi:asparaginyl-tRNA synthetase [Gorgonomyces haynaldii]|nr:asparaginyl-tRNA synthetase [Gorgonomyces haynaldii]